MRSLLRILAAFAVVAGCGDGATSPPPASSSSQGGASGPGSGGASSASAGAGVGGSEPTMALVHRVGRFDDADPAAPRFSWSGTSLRTRLDGSALEVRLDGAADVFFEIVVDGVSTGRFQTQGGEASYPLVSDLPPGQHDVEIYRRNEGFFGDVGWLELVPGPGATLVESPWPYLHRVEFIGDSITCGYGVEGPDEFCDFTGDTESAYLTYAAIASRNVAAAAHLIAFSGKGVFQNYGGDTNEPMPDLYERTLTGDPASTWDFSSFVADAVVINLGTNDFSAPVASGDFIGAYVDLLTVVRSHHPSAAIFCVSWEHWGATSQSYVSDAVTMFGDANVHEIEFTIEAGDGWGCDYHPSVTTHEKLGALLTEAFEQTLGW